MGLTDKFIIAKCAAAVVAYVGVRVWDKAVDPQITRITGDIGYPGRFEFSYKIPRGKLGLISKYLHVSWDGGSARVWELR